MSEPGTINYRQYISMTVDGHAAYLEKEKSERNKVYERLVIAMP